MSERARRGAARPSISSNPADQPRTSRTGRDGGTQGPTPGRPPDAAPADLTDRRKDGLMDDPPRLRVVGGEADAEDEQLHPEVAEFVRWFTSWWLSRGLELLAAEEIQEQRAA